MPKAVLFLRKHWSTKVDRCFFYFVHPYRNTCNKTYFWITIEICFGRGLLPTSQTDNSILAHCGGQTKVNALAQEAHEGVNSLIISIDITSVLFSVFLAFVNRFDLYLLMNRRFYGQSIAVLSIDIL